MASLAAVALLWAVNTPGAEQTPACAKTGAFERITNERLYFSLSPDGRKFELGFAGEGPTISGERGLFDMMVGVDQRREWGIAPEEQTALVMPPTMWRTNTPFTWHPIRSASWPVRIIRAAL